MGSPTKMPCPAWFHNRLPISHLVFVIVDLLNATNYTVAHGLFLQRS
jgi:hypothetical protein